MVRAEFTCRETHPARRMPLAQPGVTSGQLRLVLPVLPDEILTDNPKSQM
jgi:hypothetical protein